MRSFESSIDIVLSTKPVEQDPRVGSVVPITSTESLVAARGLNNHIERIYHSVLKNSNEDRALLATFDFLSSDMNKIRQNSFNLGLTLQQERDEPSGSRARAAQAITYLIIGQHSHKKGVWLKGSAGDKRQLSVFKKVMDSDELTFYEYEEWTLAQVARNIIYWRRQLEMMRDSKIAQKLRQAIEESDHHLIEV